MTDFENNSLYWLFSCSLIIDDDTALSHLSAIVLCSEDMNRVIIWMLIRSDGYGGLYWRREENTELRELLGLKPFSLETKRNRLRWFGSVSYTHLTLPTNREV